MTDSFRWLQRFVTGAWSIIWSRVTPISFVPSWLRPLPPTPFLLSIRQHKLMDLKGRIVVYSILGCPHCMRAKYTLQQHDLTYFDISLDKYPQCRDYMIQKTGKKTVPQIFFNATHVGGNEDLQKLFEDKSHLKKLVDDVTEHAASSDAPTIPDPSTAVEAGDPGDVVCEPDEYAHVVRDLKNSGLVRDHRKGLHVHKNSFSGNEFVDWVVRTKGLDRDSALEMGQQLIDRHFGHHVKSSETFQDAEVYYRLMEDDDMTALNAAGMSDCEPRPAGELGEEIRMLILKIYNAFLSADGKRVNYAGIAGSTEFERYVRLTKELQRVQLKDSNREEKLAFFINVYNALVVHANVSVGPPVNLWQRYKFFNTVKYIIGGNTYSLQDIENGVLRANRKGVGMFTRPFSKSDPRLKVALEEHEPLVHFALVCGAKSCPPIKTYSTDGIYDQLGLAAEAFLDSDDGCQIDMKAKHVKLSQIFKWYRDDFGKNNEEAARWLCDRMSEGSKKNQLTELLSGKSFKISFMTYDWNLNS